ncbi:alpha/beta hydrolase [Streptomyces sp. NPDC002596]|uniref:alpha/beta hydrolase n=1 Tax=unclassified Streptomyces TaxID=2593676 RepID=UPI0022596954|nr:MULTISPECIES: alpha/beta hydrolase [unclassified Streptomyces]MCX4538678.1 alpha/beta hydrolase [Streptomyces sp. NBC_01669]WSA05508.1 alpha/beta hydrolase [Streptomyces sp. NBC_00841]
MTTARPTLDPELRELLADMPLMSQLSPEVLAQLRQLPSTPVEPLLAHRQVDRREVTVPAKDGAPIPLSVFSPANTDRTTAAPCVYWMHGGGMVMGDRFSQIDIPLEWLDEFGAVVVSVDYRLAPEATGTTLVDDCYQGLLWVAEHSAELGIDPARIVVAGASAGGGLAAGVTLLARDLCTPAIAAQMLICPMLDHRNTTTSSHQYSGGAGVWTREMNEFGWRCVLGDLTDHEVPEYVSPALADDLSGLPTTYIDTGSAEVFRDEDTDYATRIWAAGGQAELHVWAGGFHGFDALYPQARISAAARQTRTAWVARLLLPDSAA